MNTVEDNGKSRGPGRPRRTHLTEVLTAEFATRLNTAVVAHPAIPKKYKGQLSWFVDRFKSEFDITIAAETVRAWLAGMFMPAPANMRRLADLMKVDEAWLANGDPSESPATPNSRNALASAEANLLAGMIGIDGGAIAFPNDDGSSTSGAHLHAIIKGAQYSIRVVSGVREGDRVRLYGVVPTQTSVLTIGVVRGEGFHFDLLEVTTDLAEAHRESTRGGYDVVVPVAEVEWITSFAQRL
jgi:hypothetical protein